MHRIDEHVSDTFNLWRHAFIYNFVILIEKMYSETILIEEMYSEKILIEKMYSEKVYEYMLGEGGGDIFAFPEGDRRLLPVIKKIIKLYVFI